MKKTSLLMLALLALGAWLPACALAGTRPGRGLGPIRFDGAEVEGQEGKEGEEAQEGAEGEESEQEAEEAEAEEEGGSGSSSQRHRYAGHKGSSARLTSLALTHGGIAALHQAHPRTSSVCFSFTLSATAKVQAVLTTQSHAGGHTSWQTVSQLTVSGKRGSNVAHFAGHASLIAGNDRLTLTPTHGSQRTIAFRVR